jgi:o-succinylbenzoate synthase
MNIHYSVQLHPLIFNKPAKTSRNVFEKKLHWIVRIWNKNNPSIVGIGEAAPIELLSPDFLPDLDLILLNKLEELESVNHLNDIDLSSFPSIKFALECALLDLANGGKQIYYSSNYLNGNPIPINGLVWMNTLDEMLEEAYLKVQQGYNCIKFKIGSYDFDSECRLLESFRHSSLGKSAIIRLDANGAFDKDDALLKIKELNRFKVHSIEQPIKAGQWEDMAKICKDAIIPIALDEELIGVKPNLRNQLLTFINPQYLIIKPTLIGGFMESEAWINEAKIKNIGWWATSALEGNIGLNAIAQWVGKFNPILPQGLGTGLLYKNNFESRSEIMAGKLYYKNSGIIYDS